MCFSSYIGIVPWDRGQSRCSDVAMKAKMQGLCHKDQPISQHDQISIGAIQFFRGQPLDLHRRERWGTGSESVKHFQLDVGHAKAGFT